MSDLAKLVDDLRQNGTAETILPTTQIDQEQDSVSDLIRRIVVGSCVR